jgi:glutamine synthetase
MNFGTIESESDLISATKNLDVKRIKVAVFDIDGIMHGKYMALDKFLSSLDSGFAFCEVSFGWNSQDQLYDNTRRTCSHTVFWEFERAAATENGAFAPVGR